VLRAAVLLACLVANTFFWATAILLGGVVKLFTRGETRRRVILALSRMGERWVGVNNRLFDFFLSTSWETSGPGQLARDGRYLLIANHLSWIDIFAVLHLFHGRTAFIRFFLKHTLLWFPFVGQACRALEFPFMRRYTPEYLERHPEKRGQDLATTQEACRRYVDIPVAILNFVEGTRLTARKHAEQKSPYRHLLRPRVGGIAFVLASLAEELDAVIDVTVIYPRKSVTFLDFLANRVEWIRVEARRIEVPPEFFDAAVTEAGPLRESFKTWVEGVWREKDQRIEDAMRGHDGLAPQSGEIELPAATSGR
jgi:1-acyl-sn-glycerol-3-phosphate acyltransferase